MDIFGKRDASSSSPRHLRRNILAGLAAFLTVTALVIGAFHLARSERAFVIGQWDRRLSVNLADPVQKVSAWLLAGKRALATVAANDTVRIYLGELQAAGFDRSAVAHGDMQAAFVASYIVDAGLQGPFAPQTPAPPAGRMAPLATAGLALFDGRQQLVASTPNYRPSPSMLAFFIANARHGSLEPQLLVVGGHPTIVFFRPVRAADQSRPAAPIGYVMGARDVGGALADALHAPLGADGGRIVLLARAAGRVRYLAASDPRDVPPASRELSLADLGGELAAARDPGRLQRGADVSGRDAFFVARAIDASPLVLVASVPTAIALAGVSERERTLLVALLLAIVAIIAIGLAYDRHRTSAAALERAELLQREATAAARREALLKIVVNAHPGALLLIGGTGKVVLASARFAGELGLATDALIGKPVETVLPPAWRAPIQAMLQRRSEAAILRSEFRDGRGRAYAAMLVFMPETVDPSGAALLLVDEVSELVEARERRAQVYRGIVAILLEAIDRRDPDAADHSRRVGALARRIAVQLGMSDADIETVDLAGNLQAVGMLFVPDRLLGKRGRLDADERARVEEGAARWLTLLAQISVDYPVAAVTRLAYELGRGHDIRTEDAGLLDKAHVVAAASAFVALTSARTYRPGRSAEEALADLRARIPGLPARIASALRASLEADFEMAGDPAIP